MNNGRSVPPYGGDQNGQNRQNGAQPPNGQRPYNYPQGQNYPQYGYIQQPQNNGQYPPQNGMVRRPVQNNVPPRSPQGQRPPQGNMPPRPPQGQRPPQGGNMPPRPPQGQRPPQRNSSYGTSRSSIGHRGRKIRKPTPFLVLILIFVLLLIIIIATSRSCRRKDDADDTSNDSNTSSSPAGGSVAGESQTTAPPTTDAPSVPVTPTDDGLYTIFIDPGHGFGDMGASSEYLTEGLKEKDMTLAVAKEIVRILTERGYAAKLTHDGETIPKSSIDNGNDKFYVDERAAYVNENSVDLFVSIHCDSYDSESVSGTRVYYCNQNITDVFNSSTESEELTGDIVSAVNKKFPDAKAAKAYGYPFDDAYYVTKHVNAPAALVEVGFITNADDAKNILDPNWRTKMAEAIADGIAKYADAHSPYVNVPSDEE